MTIEFDPIQSVFTPYVGSLSSFGAQADGKVVKAGSVTFQGNLGAGWVTIASDEYHVRRKSGKIAIREVDDDGNLVDWQDYIDYQDAGNTAFRATYIVKSGATETTYTNETVTMAEADPYLGSGDGSFDGEIPKNLYVEEIHALYGEIGGWLLSATQLLSDSGNVFLDSSVPSIGLGATGYQTGTGFWVGKAGGAYKLYIGDATNKQMYWDGSTLTAGGFTIGADYLRDAADSFGLASTVSGSDDVRFWAGATFANRATAPLQLYESGLIFAKDIILAKGSLTGASGETGYGYAVGEPFLLCHFDGARPYETDYRGSAIGHKGQVETRSGGVIFRKGMFGKAVQIAEATTNLVLNPSAETTSNFTARGTATVTRDTATYYVGATSYKVVLAAANDGVDLTLSACANAAHYVTFRATGSALSTLQVSLDNTNWNAVTQLTTTVLGATTWTYCGVSIAAAQANGSTTLRIRNTASSGTFYIDEAQCEQKSYPTPYCDGTLGTGHSWSGTAHASTSARTVAVLTYSPTGNINLAKGSISFWYFEKGVYQGFPTAIGVHIDANNYFSLHLQGYGSTIRPYFDINSGGTTRSAIYGSTVSAGWHHCAVTWENGVAVNIYIDGVAGSSAVPTTPVGTPTTIEIGSRNSANKVNTWIDDLAILPYVLTLNEIKSIYYSTAPLMLGISNQEFRLSGAGLGDVFGNANGLFGRASDGTPSFGILNGTVNATVWGGASESFDSGDFMFGSNAASKSNLIFDASAGLLAIRTATTKKVSLDSAGTVLIGSDISAAATTAFAVFAGSVTYNSESMAAGDILIGDNSTAAINIKISGGDVIFRTGVTQYLSINGNQFVASNNAGIVYDMLEVTGATGANQDLDSTGFGSGGAPIAANSVQVSSTGNWTLRSIVTGTAGQPLIIINHSANNMTVANSGANPAGYSAIRTFTGADVATTGVGSASFIFNGNNGIWELISING